MEEDFYQIDYANDKQFELFTSGSSSLCRTRIKWSGGAPQDHRGAGTSKNLRDHSTE